MSQLYERWCADCGKVLAVGHPCPTKELEAREAQARSDETERRRTITFRTGVDMLQIVEQEERKAAAYRRLDDVLARMKRD